MTSGIHLTIRDFVHTLIRPTSPKDKGEGSASGLFPDDHGALPTNDARAQWLVDELRKVEGR